MRPAPCQQETAHTHLCLGMRQEAVVAAAIVRGRRILSRRGVREREKGTGSRQILANSGEEAGLVLLPNREGLVFIKSQARLQVQSTGDAVVVDEEEEVGTEEPRWWPRIGEGCREEETRRG